MIRRLYTLFPLLIALLIPKGAWADEWQDPKTKVNYEYTPRENPYASVKAGSFGSAGSPEAAGDIVILDKISVDGVDYTVTSIGSGAFNNCRTLTSVVIPNTIVLIDAGAFSNCRGLLSVNIPNSVRYIGGSAFEICESLTSISIPSSVKSIGTLPFRACSNLSSITVESGNAVYDSRDNCNAIIKTASNELVAGCKSTFIPNSITSIGEAAFMTCLLDTFIIPNSVTSIAKNAFNNSGVSSITIPNSVKTIGEGAFQYCFYLTEVVSEITEPFSINREVFYKSFKDGTKDATLYVPSGTKAKYEATDGWKEFTHIVEMVTKGDLDGKGYTDVTDVVAAISCIMEEAGLTDEEVAILDMDGDGEVDVADIVKLIIEVIRHQKEQATAASARGGQPSAETVDLTQYTALQMTVTVPEGSGVTRMTLTGKNRDTHQIVCQQTGEGQYAVVVYSMENQPLQPVGRSLITVEGASEVKTSDVMLSTRSRERAYLNSLPAATVTGIASVQGAAGGDGSTVYDLQGRKVNAQDMKKGMYIVNGKKVVR